MSDGAFQAREEARRLRRRESLRMAALFILTPTLLSALWLVVSPPQYEVKAQFTIQGSEPAMPDLLGGVTGLAARGGADNDARILVNYLRSNAAVAVLRARYGLDGIYGLRRAPLETATEVWNRNFKVDYDGGSQIVSTRVRARRPAQALALANGVLVAGDQLVNSLASGASAGTIRYADQQFRVAQNAYNEARQRVAESQGSHSTLGLDAQSREAIAVVGGLDGELAKLRVDASTMAQTYKPDSPQMRAARTQIAALEEQLNAAIARAGSAPGPNAAGGEIQGRAALLDYEFSQRAYYAAAQAAQGARQNLQTNRRYVVTFVPPRLPERSNYWSRFVNVLVVFVVSALIYGVGALSYSVIKDHVQ